MASKHRLQSGKYQIRWREKGKNRATTVPSNRAANRKIREIEERQAAGKSGQPGPAREAPELPEIHRAYLRSVARHAAPSSVSVKAVALDTWEEWLNERHHGERLSPSLLTRKTLGEFYDYLLVTGKKGKPRRPATAYNYVGTIHAMWEWAEDDETYEEFMPRPRRLKLTAPIVTYPQAPTWAQMDAMIVQCWDAYRRMAIIMRFTGLRPTQARQLRWEDVSLSDRKLRIRGELGKSAQEKRGRVVPLSQHFTDILKAWPRHPSDPLIVNQSTGTLTPATIRDHYIRAWQRSGAPSAIYLGAPSKAFRRGFQSSLKQAGADDEAVKFLVGHSRGTRGHYVDPQFLPASKVVALIPPFTGEIDSDIKSVRSCRVRKEGVAN